MEIEDVKDIIDKVLDEPKYRRVLEGLLGGAIDHMQRLRASERAAEIALTTYLRRKIPELLESALTTTQLFIAQSGERIDFLVGDIERWLSSFREGQEAFSLGNEVLSEHGFEYSFDPGNLAPPDVSGLTEKPRNGFGFRKTAKAHKIGSFVDGPFKSGLHVKIQSPDNSWSFVGQRDGDQFKGRWELSSGDSLVGVSQSGRVLGLFKRGDRFYLGRFPILGENPNFSAIDPEEFVDVTDFEIAFEN